MDSLSSTTTGRFPRQAATASVIAPALVFVLSILLHPLLHGNLIGQIVFTSISILLIAVGLILGIVALICMTRYGTEGILWKALSGTVLNVLFALSILAVAMFSAATGRLNAAMTTAAAPEMTSYDKEGVQFLYNSEWVVKEEPGAANGNHATKQITIQRRDNGGAICISLYPSNPSPGYKLLDLESYGRELVQTSGGSADPQVAQITGNIGGVNQPGVRLHFSSLRISGMVFTGDGDFYRLRTAKHDIVVNAMTRENMDTTDATKAILASLKIDGDSDGDTTATAVTGAATASTTAPAAVDSNFIPAMNCVDMVHDLKRNILYITAGDSVLRYKLDAKSFLAPWVLGGDLKGIDLSPDNSHIAVADGAGGNGRVCIHVVDLETGNDTPASFTANLQESGTYSVAYGADGQIWISSSISGSGWLPLRKYNPPTHSVMKLQPTVSQDTMLAASADRQSIGFAEGQMTPGTYGRILYRASQLPPKPMRADGFLYEIAISRDGSQLAAPGYNSTILAGAQVPKLDEPAILGAVYHPQRNYLFVSQAGTSLISVYDTSNYSKVKDLDLGDAFEWSGHAFDSGRLRISQDGFYLFCTVRGGIRFTETGI